MRIYFLANGENKNENPYFSHLYKVDLSGKNLKTLTPETGNHSINWSPDHKYFVDNYSTPIKPNTAVLRKANGKVIKKLEEENIQALRKVGGKHPKNFQ